MRATPRDPGTGSFLAAVVIHDLATLLAFAEETRLRAGVVPVALDLLLGLRGMARERHGEQALLRDRLRGDLADAVGAVVISERASCSFDTRLSAKSRSNVSVPASAMCCP